MAKRIEASVKKIVIREHNRAPNLGVRDLSKLLKEKHKIILSKSTISNILRKKGTPLKKGRKKAILSYQSKQIADCGLVLLRCIDSKIGLFDCLADELKIYFSKISHTLLKKFLILATLSAYRRSEVKENIQRSGFLRLADLHTLPARRLSYFLESLIEYKPALATQKIKDNVVKVLAVKFYFNNGAISFCDGRLSTLWDGPCFIEDFSSTLLHTKNKLSMMIKQKSIVINYTKSFDYLSKLAFNFIEGIESGIKKIEILGQKGKILEELKLKDFNPYFFIGYYPKILGKGIKFLEKVERFKRLRAPLGDVLYAEVATQFSDSKGKKELILHNLLAKRKERSLPAWGILTNRKRNIEKFLADYLLFFPYMESVFLAEIEQIEKSYASKNDNKKDYKDFIPDMISLEKEADFANIAYILDSILKEDVKIADLKGKRGQITLAKDHITLSIKNIPSKTKDQLNKACFYLNNKRVFLT